MSTKEINDKADELYKKLKTKLHQHRSELLNKNKDELNTISKSTIVTGAILICAIIAGIIVCKFIQSRRLKNCEENDNVEYDNEKNNDKAKMSIDTKMSA